MSSWGERVERTEERGESVPSRFIGADPSINHGHGCVAREGIEMKAIVGDILYVPPQRGVVNRNTPVDDGQFP